MNLRFEELGRAREFASPEFIASAMRKRGIGTAITTFSVDFAKQLKKSRLTVCPHPLSDQPLDDLIDWYKRRGFKPTNDPKLFEIARIPTHS